MPAAGRKHLAKGVSAKGRSAGYKAKGLWAIKAKNGGKFPVVSSKTVAKPATEEKKVKSGTRTVATKKVPATFVNQPNAVRKTGPKHVPKVRSSITPGRVCIVLSGKYAGKRVVVVKALQSGLVVVTGPSSLNTVPLRRVNPAYLIATSIRLNFATEKVYSVLNKNKDAINDKLFEREKAKISRSTKTAEERKAGLEKRNAARKDGTAPARKVKTVLKTPRTIVKLKKNAAKAQQKSAALSEKAKLRKSIAKELDAALLKEVKKTPLLDDYLGSRFSLQKGQYPHELKF